MNGYLLDNSCSNDTSIVNEIRNEHNRHPMAFYRDEAPGVIVGQLPRYGQHLGFPDLTRIHNTLDTMESGRYLYCCAHW